MEVPEKFGITDIGASQKFSILQINAGKIIVKTSTKLKKMSQIFEFFIVVVIFMSCVVLCINTPLENPDTSFSQTLLIFDIIFTIIFTIEAALKIIAFGFFWNKYENIPSYTRSIWNFLDFVVVVVSLVDLYYYLNTSSDNVQNLSSIKALRAIRAIRPLRMVSKSKGLRIVVQALFASIPSMGNVLIICILFLLIFAILGVNFFKGAYYYWNIQPESLLENVSDIDSWIDLGGTWEKIGANFDNVFIACVTLFEMMTTEGWVDTMNNGIDAKGIEKQPKVENNRYMAIYFVIFIILGWFFIINLFTAVITDNFFAIKEAQEIGAGETVDELQKQWVQVQNTALKINPVKRLKKPDSQLRYTFFKIVTKPWFDLTIIILIILNTIVLAMTYARMSNNYETMLLVLNYIFVFTYNVEMVSKLIGLGKQYFTHDSWNIFDFICVIGSDLSVIFVITGIDGPLHSIFIFLRAFRVIRLMRFVNAYGGSATISTLIDSAPQIQNILTLIILITFIYATLGINLFATVMYRNVYNEQNNFRNIFDALLLLIRWLTGEDWNLIMHELARSDPHNDKECVNNQTYEEMQADGILGCGSAFSYPFFISYFILNAIIILDLSIGVFITALREARQLRESMFNQNQINNFIKLWADYDPDSTKLIHVDQLLFLIFELPIPYGWGKVNPEHENIYSFKKVYQKRVKENEFQVEAMTKNLQKNIENMGEEILHTDVVKRIKYNNEIYLVNESKGLTIREMRTPLILSNMNIPIYTGNVVHFKDVFQQIVKNAFDYTGEPYLPDVKLQAKLKKKWTKQIKRKDITLDMADEYMAGKMIFNRYKFLRHNRIKLVP